MSGGVLDDLPPEERQRILDIARRRTFRRHEVVFHRDDPADTLHLVTKGRFGVQITTPYGDTALLNVVLPGQSFGELALIAPERARSATVMAFEASETRSLHRLDFERLRKEQPQVGDVLVALLAERVRRLSELLVDATFASAETRVLRRLSELAGAGDAADIPLTQEELAQLAGTSRATVNRVLGEAAERGELTVRRGRVAVCDRDRLAQRCRRR